MPILGQTQSLAGPSEVTCTVQAVHSYWSALPRPNAYSLGPKSPAGPNRQPFRYHVSLPWVRNNNSRDQTHFLGPKITSWAQAGPIGKPIQDYPAFVLGRTITSWAQAGPIGKPIQDNPAFVLGRTITSWAFPYALPRSIHLGCTKNGTIHRISGRDHMHIWWAYPPFLLEDPVRLSGYPTHHLWVRSGLRPTLPMEISS
jgi:hypothetical protein